MMWGAFTSALHCEPAGKYADQLEAALCPKDISTHQKLVGTSGVEYPQLNVLVTKA